MTQDVIKRISASMPFEIEISHNIIIGLQYITAGLAIEFEYK